MSTVILDGLKEDELFSDTLREVLEEAGEELNILRLGEMNIGPCRNCGACNDKTPGACIQEDDTPKLMRALVRSKRFAILTRLSFGGYASVTKKALDKLVLMGISTFTVDREGRLQHKKRYPEAKSENVPPNLVIAITQGESEAEKQCFRKLVEANGRIMMIPFKLIFIDVSQDKESIKQKMIHSLKEEQS